HYIDRKASKLETLGIAAINKVYWMQLVRWSIINFIGFGWIIAIGMIGFYGCYQGWLSAGAYATMFFLGIAVWTSLEEFAKVQDELFEYNNGMRRLIETLRTPIAPLDIEPLQALPAN